MMEVEAHSTAAQEFGEPLTDVCFDLHFTTGRSVPGISIPATPMSLLFWNLKIGQASSLQVLDMMILLTVRLLNKVYVLLPKFSKFL